VIFATFVFSSLLSFAADPAREVVVYCPIDRPYAEPILQSFEKETGIKVRAVYDSEAVKTVGLVNRLIAEKKRPQCDVFWNNEKLRMVQLAQRGLLDRYEPYAWKERKLPHDQKDGLWTEFAARARVIVYNTKKTPGAVLKQLRSSSESTLLSDPPEGTRPGFCFPLIGTASTHLLDLVRDLRILNRNSEQWLETVSKKVVICTGNSDVVARVAAGQLMWGFTDTDDVVNAKAAGDPVDWIFPHFRVSSTLPLGPLFLPNTVAIMKGAPHRKEAEALVDYLLSEKTEIALAKGPSQQIPLGTIHSEKARDALPLTRGNGPLAGRVPRYANEEALMKTHEADLELLKKYFQQ
jgi:iron(III) transport system substrate-binding protein